MLNSKYIALVDIKKQDTLPLPTDVHIYFSIFQNPVVLSQILEPYNVTPFSYSTFVWVALRSVLLLLFVCDLVLLPERMCPFPSQPIQHPAPPLQIDSSVLDHGIQAL